MASAIESPREATPKHGLGTCGGCSYAYDPTDGCYHRRTNGCSAGCSCPALICGLGSLLVRRLRPKTMTAAATVSLGCSSGATSDEEWFAEALYREIKAHADAATFWRRASIGLGVLSGLLAMGLAVALVYR